MLIDPKNGALKMIVNNAEGWENPGNANLWRAMAEDFLTRLAKLITQSKGVDLQVCTIDYLPAWTLMLIDPRSEKGVAYVELATFRANPRNRPTFSLTIERDTRLFERFQDEYEEMWRCARPLDTRIYVEEAT